MGRGELYIPPQRLTRNAVNGRFMKGHVPFNKGKNGVTTWICVKQRE